MQNSVATFNIFIKTYTSLNYLNTLFGKSLTFLDHSQSYSKPQLNKTHGTHQQQK